MHRLKHPLWLGLLVAFGSDAARGCDLERMVAHGSKRLSLLDAASRLAEISECQVVLAGDLATTAGAVAIAGAMRVADALDRLSVDHGLNWTQRADGVIEIVSGADARAQSLDAATLRVDATAISAPGASPSIIGQSLLPSERGVLIARTEIGEARVADEAIRDYATAVLRAPGVYSMASTDAMRGIGASRLPSNQRASLVTLDGVPLPSEASLYSQNSFRLLRSMQITRVGTGLANALGAGGGDIALATAEPQEALDFGLHAGSADHLAPHVAATMTWDFGVPGLRTSLGASVQTEPEAIDDAGEQNVYKDKQISARLSWQSSEQRHLLLGSYVDLANGNLGGLEFPGFCADPLCPAGAEIALSGGALSWRWLVGTALSVTASAGMSDTRSRSAILRDGHVRFSAPTVLQLRYADLRADYTIDNAFSASLGVSGNRRDRDAFSQTFIDLVEDGGPGLGLSALAPGPAHVQWRTRATRRTELPQAYAELRYDDGSRWDGHLGARLLDSHVGFQTSISDIRDANCAVEPDRVAAGFTTCAAVVTGLLSGADEDASRPETKLLPNFGVRRRLNDAHWFGAQWRSSFVVGDVLAAALNLGSAIEPIDTFELTWHREFPNAVALEARVFRHHWSDRFAFAASNPTPFTTNVTGLELEYRWQPEDHFEFWAHAALLRGSQSDRSVAPGSDGELVGAPKRSSGIGGRYRFDHGFYLGGHLAHADAAYAADATGYFQQLRSRDLLDARIGFRQQHVDVSLWGTNLLNDDYRIDQLGTTPNPNAFNAYDRVVGIDVSVLF